MSQRERVSIIGIGVIMGIAFGLIYNDLYKCLITGIVTAAVITVRLSQLAKKSTRK